MAIQLSHPDAAQLQAFNQGRLEDEAASTAIGAHLDTCADCRRTLESLSGDTLENLVRSADPNRTESADTPPGVSEPAQPIPERLEYFLIERVLGAGGMGTVYLADDTRLHRKVALKTLRRELAEKPGPGSASCARPARRLPWNTITSCRFTMLARRMACRFWPCPCSREWRWTST